MSAAPTGAPMLTKTQFLELRARLGFDPSPSLALATLALHAATLSGGFWLLQQRGWAAQAVAQTVLAVGAFQAFALLHECGHGSFSGSTAVDVLVGHLVSPFCFLPFYTWKHIHHQHHVWAGHLEKDPAVRKLHEWRSTGRVPVVARIAWRSWVPVVALMQQVVFWVYPLSLRREGRDAVKLAQCVGSIVFLVAVYAVFAVSAVRGGWNVNVLPAAAVYLFITELVNLPHHTDLPGYGRKLAAWEQPAIARSCVYPRLVSELCVLNFNFHIEHHVFPDLPWYRLRTARALLKPALGAGYHEEVGLGWNLAQRTRDLRDVVLVESRQ